MNRILNTLLAAALFGLCASPPASANLLVNPGFESGALAPWALGNDLGAIEFWNVISSDAHSGTYSATTRGNNEIVQMFAAVATSAIVEASMWLKMPETGIAFISLYYSDATGGGDLFNIGADWAQYDITSLLDPGKMLVGFGVYGCSGCPGDSRTLMDDAVIDVRGAPEPATLALLALGLAGIGVSLRRKGR